MIAIGTMALRLQCPALPLSAWIIPSNMLLQTIGESGRASPTSISRQGLFFLPAILLVPPRLGILGVQISQPIADIFSFLVATLVTVSVLRRLKAKVDKRGLHDSSGSAIQTV